VQQTRELGIEAPIIGANGAIPQIYLAGSAVENSTYIPYNISYTDQKIIDFDKKFQERWNFETNAQTYIAMDALSAIVAAAAKAGTSDPEALTVALNGIQVDDGWMGPFSISEETHMPVGMSMAILNVIDGKPNTVTTLKTD
jgi:ABC-type branched-subunit amino acid transport system substrate-binding protein